MVWARNAGIAEATGFRNVHRFESARAWAEMVPDILLAPGPTLVHAVLEHTDALLCGPNPNWLLHAPATSFGNPFRVTSDWTVVDGSGVYDGVTGGGTWSVRWAGGAGSGGHVGVLTD